jgi:DNA-binding transcriptional regulator YdaS (Cro superfamily)
MKANPEGMRKAIACCGSQQALADAIGVSRGAVAFWSLGVNSLSPLDALKIERATGGVVRREEMLEVFDRTWAKRNVFVEAAWVVTQ